MRPNPLSESMKKQSARVARLNRIPCNPCPYSVQLRVILALRRPSRESQLAGSTSRFDLSQLNRKQNGKTTPSAVRANLDDPPIHIRPIVPASASAKEKNPVGSSHYGMPNIASRLLNRNGFLCGKCQQSG
jgi:hypothetical protein